MQTSSSRIPGQTAGAAVPATAGALASELPTPIAAFDRQGNFTWVNGAFAALGGLKAEAFTGSAPAHVLPAPLARQLEAGIAKALGGRASHAQVAPPPGVAKLQVHCFPTHDGAGEVNGAGCQLTMLAPAGEPERP